MLRGEKAQHHQIIEILACNKLAKLAILLYFPPRLPVITIPDS